VAISLSCCGGVCHEASEELASCIEDGSRPPGVDFQELASNYPELLRSKGVVVNVRGKGVRKGRQVSAEKMSESKPADDASSSNKELSKLEPPTSSRTSREGACLLARRQSVYRRHDLSAALVRNMRTSLWMKREMTSG
jgi:hypothetical protein